MEARQPVLEANSGHRITLNVGGMRFLTSRATLLNEPNSYFCALLNSQAFQPDEAGEYFVDRNPRFFQELLDYWRQNRRDGWLPIDLHQLSFADQMLLAGDIEFYNIESVFWLVNSVQMTRDEAYMDQFEHGDLYFEVVRKTFLPSLPNFQPLTVRYRISGSSASDEQEGVDLTNDGDDSQDSPREFWGGLLGTFRPDQREGEIILYKPGKRKRVSLGRDFKPYQCGSLTVSLVVIECSQPAIIVPGKDSTFCEVV